MKIIFGLCQIAAPLTSMLGSLMKRLAGEASFRNDDISTQMGVGSGSEVEVDEVEVGVVKMKVKMRTTKFKSYGFCYVQKTGLRSGLFDLRIKSTML